MTKKGIGRAKKVTAIALAAAMIATGTLQPLQVSASETDSSSEAALQADGQKEGADQKQTAEKEGEEESKAATTADLVQEEESKTPETSETASIEGTTQEETTSEEESLTQEQTTSEDETSTEEETTSQEEITTEEETTEEALTEEYVQINSMLTARAAFMNAKTIELDLTSGLSVGSTYMDGMVSVGTDMTYKAGNAVITSVLDSAVTKEAAGYVTNSSNPLVEDGTGALLRFTPNQNGTLSVSGQLGGNKTFYVATKEGDTIYSYENGAEKLNLLFEEISVEADKTYYIYAKSTKMRFYGLSFTFEDEPEEEVIPTTSEIPAFPGVEGGGKYITGGRGRQVYTVTNLNDDGEGSLRWALEQTKATDGGTIVFNVAGNIELKSSLRFDGVKNVTIAGQTAPGEGITVSGYDTNISNSENIIIRYMRFRPGALNVHSGGDSMDAMWGRDNDGFVIDHCSFSWNTDECLSLYRGENGTVQWCVSYESLTLSGHKKGRHGYGGITGGDNVTFHHNLYANHTSRNPRLGGGYAGNADENHVAVVQMNNNLIYNWGFNTTYGGGYTFTNFVNNYAVAGPGTRDSVADWVINPGESSKVGGFYINQNYIADYTDPFNGLLTGLLSTVDAVNAHGSFAGATEGSNATSLVTSPYLSADSTGVNAGVTNQGFDEYTSNLPSAQSSYEDILKMAGATYPVRDAQDARIVAEVRNGEGRYINTEHEVGGYLTAGGVITQAREAGFDSDADGIPDAWEQENGLDAQNAQDGAQISDLSKEILGTEGYTNLEVYLCSLVDMEHVAENPKAEITSIENNEMFAVGEEITIAVSAGSDFGHDVVKAEFYYGTLQASQKFGEAQIVNGKAQCTLSGLADGSYFVMARVYDSEGNAVQTSSREIHVNTSGTELEQAGWTSQSIGEVDVTGYGSLSNGILTVKGNGKLGKEEGSKANTKEADASTDAFHYVYQEWEGDMELTAKLESISSVDNHAFAGIMIREDLEEDSAAAVLGLSWTKTDDSIGLPWAMYLAGRDTKGGSMSNLADPLDNTTAEGAAGYGILLRPAVKFKNGATELGYWMRLVRNDDTFTAYCSADGVQWELIGSKTIPMGEKVYIGFAADSNRVANDMEQVNTARFSNIDIKSNIYDITYQLEGIGLANKPETITEGNNLTLTLTTELGYRLPETVSVKIGDAEPVSMALELSDPMEGTLTITGINGAVVIEGAALVDTEGVEQVSPIIYDENGYLTVTQEEKALILVQSAESGRMTSKPASGELAQNVSYFAFPKTTDSETMEMDITILSRVNDDTSKDKGLFVGVFEIGNEREYFTSLGFRNVSGLAGDDGKGGLTGYWIKDPVTKGAGNGGSKSNIGAASNDYNTKPSYELNKTYHVVFEKTSNGYKVTYQGTYAGADSGVYPNGKADKEEMDLYKIFADDMLTLEDEVQYGIALIGVTAKIENLTLKDSKGRTIYDLNQTTQEEEPTDDPTDDPNIRPDGGNTDSNTNQNNNAASSSQQQTNAPTAALTQIVSEQVALAAEITQPGLPYAEIVFTAQEAPKAVLQYELLSKYYGRHLYLLAHLGNGIGYSISEESLQAVTQDIVVGAALEEMKDFAEEFTTYHVKPLQEKSLSYEIGLHICVGTEYTGKAAYLFSKNLTTGTYQLAKVMPVSENGNVALTTTDMSELMILIQK